MLFKPRFSLCHLRWFSSKAKVKLNDSFNALLESKETKHRKHPGIIKRSVLSLPKPILEAMKIVLEDVENKSELYAQCIKFRNHLNGRHVPMEENDVRKTYETVQQNLIKKKVENLSDEEIEALCKKNRPKALQILKQKVNMWQSVNYDEQRSLLYMAARSSQDYAVLHAIFNEIRTRDKKFNPETVFDFGSGIGTTMWAINELWPRKVKEFMNIDISNDINSLSEKIIKILYPNYNGIFYRQFMPMTLKPNYDITVSAYSLMELPNVKTRLDTIMKLWKKTKNYLVIVEQGTNAGFSLVTEARDFILHLSNMSEEKEKSKETHTFAPCPHDSTCPRLTATDSIPCNFEVGYASLSLLRYSKTNYERYSYVVLKKGPKSESDGEWPRIISPTLKRGKHVICRICASSGNLEEIIFTRSKHGRNLYRCARVSDWGDRLPVEKNVASDAAIENESTSKDKEESKVEIDKESDCETKKECVSSISKID